MSAQVVAVVVVANVLIAWAAVVLTVRDHLRKRWEK